jgi:hypothetical protein
MAMQGISPSAETQTIASVTYQSFFKQFPKLSGMSGTARCVSLYTHVHIHTQIFAIQNAGRSACVLHRLASVHACLRAFFNTTHVHHHVNSLFRSYRVSTYFSTEAKEFQAIYNLPVVSIPTALPVARRDNDDVTFRTQARSHALYCVSICADMYTYTVHTYIHIYTHIHIRCTLVSRRLQASLHTEYLCHTVCMYV